MPPRKDSKKLITAKNEAKLGRYPREESVRQGAEQVVTVNQAALMMSDGIATGRITPTQVELSRGSGGTVALSSSRAGGSVQISGAAGAKDVAAKLAVLKNGASLVLDSPGNGGQQLTMVLIGESKSLCVATQKKGSECVDFRPAR